MPDATKHIEKAPALPTMSEIIAWWDEFGMLENIREHSVMVTKVALLVTDWVVESGFPLNRDFVRAGAMLHDIAKTPCLDTDRLHSEEGYEILLQKGYPELAHLIRVHVYLPRGCPLNEAMVVNYADKRVNHNYIVNLNQRYDYIAKRYGRGDPERLDRIDGGRKRAFEVQTTIFDTIGLAHTPEEIAANWKDT